MYDIYTGIFVRLGLKFRAVAGAPGAIGGTESREFHVLAESGEDAIAYCPQSEYAANVELAETVAQKAARSATTEKMRKVATPNRTRCEDVAKLLGVPIEKTVKAIAVIREEARDGASGSFAMLLVRGDHDLNEVKTQKVIGAFRFARDEEIERTLKCGPGYIGPVSSVPLNLYADRTVAAMSDFVCGANEAGFHLTGV